MIKQLIGMLSEIPPDGGSRLTPGIILVASLEWLEAS